MDPGAPSVLIVDDEPHILQTVAFSLRAFGFEVHPYALAREALDALARDRYDLAFVDLMMAPVDGWAVLAEVLLRAPETTVIVMTAQGTPGRVREAIDRGAFACLSKPFDLHQLQGVAQRALEHHRLAGAARTNPAGTPGEPAS